MRVAQCVLAIAVAAILGSTTTSAQAPAPSPAATLPTRIFASSQDVTALVEKAKRDRKPGQATVLEPILVLAPYRANLEYRAGVGPAAIHVHEDEFFYIMDGSGTLVTGGKLVHSVQTNAENFTGDAIEGGKAVHVSKGDFIVVPQNTPHWFSKINGHVTDMSLHVPGSKGQ